MTNPPPVVKSHGIGTWCAYTGVLLNISKPANNTADETASANNWLIFPFSLSLIFPFPLFLESLDGALRNARGCGRDHNISNPGNSDVQGIYDGGAGG